MKEVKIEEENINKDKNKKTETEYRYFNYGYTQNASNKLIDLKKYYYLYLFILSIFIFSKIFDKKPIINNNKKITLEPYINYVNNCTNLKRYDKIKKIKTEKPYISVCLPVHNMEKYIERSILSIINQSFQNFEIIIVNDYSEDNTYNILQKLQKEDNRIKIITHTQKLGVYTSRIEAILLSKAKYIILMDPDDMYLNQNLFQELYDYNRYKNLDIIEFSVYHQNEGTEIIFNPYDHRKTHYHYFDKNIIYQPELSEILFYKPKIKEYSHTICRNIWNKLIRKEVFIDMIEYIGYNYYKDHFVITADDILMNVISYHFAHNYSNINLPGYLYTIRKSSMSRGEGGQKLEITRSINYLLYFNIFYKYIKEFNKDRNFLYYELKDLSYKLYPLKNSNETKYISGLLYLLNEIMNDNYASNDFKKQISELISYFKIKI